MTDRPFPPVVYAPTREPRDGGATRLAMHRTDDGRVARFVYSGDALADTGGAIADGAGAVVDGIGGLFD